EEFIPPASPVQMVFESGNRNGPSAPNPDIAPSPGSPPSEAPPAPQAAAPPPQPEPLPVPVPPTPPPPTPPQPKPQPPQPQVAEPAAPPPAPQPEAPPERAAPLPPPPAAAEVEVPKPPPPAKTLPPLQVPAPVPPPPKPVQRPQPPPPPLLAQPQPLPKPSKPSDFPAPTNFSLGGPRTPSRQQQASSGATAFSYGPVRKGAENNSPFADIDNDNGGPDWRNALIRWAQQNAYYPPEARADFEEGTSRVHVEATANGRVTSVELIGRSGSIWLDLALQSLFRDKRIPPIPGSSKPIEFNFAMHYILIRR
ncbi:MAG: TonB family protein, partial [Rhodopila sp.]